MKILAHFNLLCSLKNEGHLTQKQFADLLCSFTEDRFPQKEYSSYNTIYYLEIAIDNINGHDRFPGESLKQKHQRLPGQLRIYRNLRLRETITDDEYCKIFFNIHNRIERLQHD